MIRGVPYNAEVEYLESTGTQWIDTGFKADRSTVVKCALSVVSRAINGYVVWGAAKGDGSTGLYDAVALAEKYNNPSTLFLLDTYNNNNAQSISYGQDMLIECVLSDGSITINGTTTSDNHYTINKTAAYPIWVFGENLAGNLFRPSKIRLKFLQILQSDVLARDFIPVRFTNESGQSEGAMYDRVTRRLFRDQGTGAFLYGADVAKPVMGLHMFQKPPLTARDYVQDGLVAMWDAIENISIGASDHSQPYVYNIVPNGPVLTIGGVTFDEVTKSYSSTRSSAHISADPALCSGFVNRNCTVEFFSEAAANSANGWGAAVNPQVDTFSYVFYSTGNNFLAVKRTSGVDFISPTDKTHSSIVIDGGTMRSYCGGVIDKTANLTSTGYQYVNVFGFLSIPKYTMSFASGMRCFRLYSRALTAAEIAHNYAVDKERFRLP